MGNRLLRYKGISATWVDVGAHLGEKTFQVAKENPSLIVYAFEPNLKIAVRRIGLLPNFIVIPMAVTEKNGYSDFYINTFNAASSVLPFNNKGLKHWVGGEDLRVENMVTVPTIRLDTFMNLLWISKVDYMKIDAQGADFMVIKSAGDRLKDIEKISLEVQITPISLYSGAASKEEIVDYLKKSGFALVDCKKQSCNQEENLTFMRISNQN